MRIGVLTSSRADYGIYLPLLSKLKKDSFFDVEIIAFGTHLSNRHGFTVTDIEKDGYNCILKVYSLLPNDNANGIASTYGLTALKFADFWAEHNYDLVLCLGDRFEMSAAVQAGIPFNVKFAHIHGGETTLGAIDNIYRHQISLASILHFTATEVYKDKVGCLVENAQAYDVGSLSIDEVKQLKFAKRNEFLAKFSIPDTDFALITFHPETTVNADENNRQAVEMSTALAELSKRFHLIVTMPNADTLGSVFRAAIASLKEQIEDRLTIIENFGKQHYFDAMKHCAIMIGNTSSGIIEAASFGKYVINVGNRQQGRIASSNVIHCAFTAAQIIDCTLNAMTFEDYKGTNIYYKSGAADTIISIFKENHAKL